jgi:drug/metabolite transporter (DMT)-like permease
MPSRPPFDVPRLTPRQWLGAAIDVVGALLAVRQFAIWLAA